MIEVGGMLPPETRAQPGAESWVSLRGLRGPQVLVAVHSPHCDGCRNYLRKLTANAMPITEWSGRIVVVLPGDVAVTPPAVVVADEWGEVYAVMHGAPDHVLPSAAEIGEWVRFVAIQCPECEGPEGPWRTVR